MPVLDLSYANHASVLVARADLRNGWGRLKHTYGFNASQNIDFRGNSHFRVQLTVCVVPATLEPRASSFPDASVDFGTPLFPFSLHDGFLTAQMALSIDQPWRILSTGRLGLFINEPVFLVLEPQLWLDLRMLVVLHENTRMHIPTIREWGERFFVSGGQFESNRRRH